MRKGKHSRRFLSFLPLLFSLLAGILDSQKVLHRKTTRAFGTYHFELA